MSYLTASTRNTIGMKTLARQVGMSGFGALGTGAADAMDAGVSTNVVALLVKYGATDDQLEAIAQNPDSEDVAATLLQQLAAGQAEGPSTFQQIGASFKDFFTNALTGGLSENQVGQLQQQEQATLVKAGMPVAQAQTQVQQDTGDALESFTGSGAFGLTWAGGTAAQSAGNEAMAFLGTYWPWLLGAGIIMTVGPSIVKKL